MKKLKIILKFNYIYYLIFLFAILYVFININFINYNYKNLSNNLKGYVNDYYIDGNKLTIILLGEEKKLLNYYFKTEKEKNNFKICYGDYIKVNGIFDEIKENTNFNLFNYKKYLKTKKINYSLKVENIKIIKKNNNLFYYIKNQIVLRINNNISSDYLKTFILGDKRNINQNIIESYQKLGVSHLLAISGMHVSFLSMILLKILKKLNVKIRYSIVMLFLIFYLFLTNYTISILRATMQFILFSINKLFNLKIKNINIMLLIISIVLIYNPYYIYDVSFLFSFSISFSLILFGKKINNIKNYFYKGFTTSLISFLVSLPILINNFYEINFLSIIYNVFYIPFVSYILFPINILNLIFPFLDRLNNFFINIFEIITINLSKINILTFQTSRLSLFLIIIYYIVLYFAISKKRKKYIISIFIFIIFFINNNRFVLFPTITFLDVGQGDSMLIRILNKNILIDTGGKIVYEEETWKKRNKEYGVSNNVIVPYLKSVGVKKINYLILTHGDYDHMGEAINLVNNFKIEKVIFNCGEENELETKLIKVLNKKKIVYYSCVKELNIDKYKLQFLNTGIYDNENNNSSVIYIVLNNYKFLFMGDAGVEVEEDLIEKYNLQDIDVLKVGHHGSKTSSDKKFINEINNKYSVISVGKNNRYGHPNITVLNNLKKSKIYRTDQNGSIIFEIKKGKLNIKTCIP